MALPNRDVCKNTPTTKAQRTACKRCEKMVRATGQAIQLKIVFFGYWTINSKQLGLLAPDHSRLNSRSNWGTYKVPTSGGEATGSWQLRGVQESSRILIPNGTVLWCFAQAPVIDLISLFYTNSINWISWTTTVYVYILQN